MKYLSAHTPETFKISPLREDNDRQTWTNSVIKPKDKKPLVATLKRLALHDP